VPPTLSEYIKTVEVAALIGVCPDTIARWVRSGERNFPPPALKGRRGKSHRWKRADIEKWLAEQEASADVA
jgi:predicted DNA-binding transcriptional regulator AlpA